MKTVENKGFGFIGIKVELSWIELAAISELAEDLREAWNYGEDTPLPIVKAINFLHNLSSFQVKDEIKRAGNEMFSDKEALEDLKNECELNGLENESPER